MAEKTGPQKIIDQAYTDLIERVSVAGWQEIFQEKIKWIRRIFQSTLLICSAFCIYYSSDAILKYLRSGYNDEIKDFPNREFLPFSNVTVCAQIYFNETFVKENITISKKLAEKYKRETGNDVDDLYRQLTTYLSFTWKPHFFTPRMVTIYFDKIIAANPQIFDISTFANHVFPTCERMLKKCSFNGQEFDCCRQAVQSVDGDGICYLLKLNFDSDNATPSNKTRNQTKAGPNGGLTIEASLDVKDFPWSDEKIGENGFKIFVNAVPYTDIQSPLGAPNGAETFIKVTPSKHLLSRNCARNGHLSMPGGEFMYYDPEGSSCFYRDFQMVIQKHINCYILNNLYRPNSSTACHPVSRYLASMFFFNENPAKEIDKLGFRVDATADTIKKLLKEMDIDWRTALSRKSYCPSHCQYWTYSSSVSFSNLENSLTKMTSYTIMYSKIHVYYADLEYRQYEEVQEKTIYLAFCDFGNIVGLYWGMSIVSFFHVLYYVPRYFYVTFKFRKYNKVGVANIKTVVVAPASSACHAVAVPEISVISVL